MKFFFVHAIAADNFREEFKKIVQEDEYFRDKIYNADKTGLNWKALPNKKLTPRTTSSASGHKFDQDSQCWLRLMLVVNMRYTACKWPSANAKIFNNNSNLPVVYRNKRMLE